MSQNASTGWLLYENIVPVVFRHKSDGTGFVTKNCNLKCAADPAIEAVRNCDAIQQEFKAIIDDPAGGDLVDEASAKLCGACPIPASSGKTTRHRLNRGGNRQANAALYRVVIIRMRSHSPTRAYVRKRMADGKGKMEIIRCLKRFVAREIFGYLCRASRTPTTLSLAS